MKTAGAFLASLAALVAVVLLFSAGSTATWAADVVVSNARLGKHPDKTRFVVDLSSTVEFRIFTLANPERVVIDLPEVAWQMPFASGERGGGDVARIRYDLYRAGTSRIVLDLTKPLEVRDAFVLVGAVGESHRLVLDLVPTSPAAFDAKAGWPEDQSALGTGTVSSVVLPPSPKPKVLSKRKRVIVIDPGHGGRDPGAVGANGTHEAEVVLAFAKAAKAKLDKTGRYKTILTRTEDTSLALRDRIDVARTNKADLFLSLHADLIVGRPNIRGASVYTLSEKGSDSAAEELAAKENQADILIGVDMAGNSDEVNNILIDLAMRDTLNASVKFARLLTPELGKAVPLLKNPNRSAGFVVLKAPDVPSVLIELGYLSNKSDEKNLNSDAWRSKAAQAIAAALDRYFDTAAVTDARG